MLLLSFRCHISASRRISSARELERLLTFGRDHIRVLHAVATLRQASVAVLYKLNAIFTMLPEASSSILLKLRFLGRRSWISDEDEPGLIRNLTRGSSIWFALPYLVAPSDPLLLLHFIAIAT
ncbi:hypothetical protein BU16DRAFT_324532 [Lophium mytilinum]|uniref:Uncharacterized protein n=1 Tax=Lophium mytilinum TaxID=390894 RepID=A0A6A6QZP3_9PEZI|nr:hypothetical protein BU16DRAFT_324532 [Lophium mytilinum]